MSRRRRVSTWCALAPMILLIAGTSAASQSPRVIRGTVLDSRDQPVAFAAIAVTGGGSAASDDSGKFRLEIPHRNRVVFDVRRLGFTPSRMALGPGADTTVSVLLLPSAQRLSGVDVNELAPKPIGLAGFEARMVARQRQAGTGHFLTSKDIEAMAVTRTTQVVENVPSILVRRVNGDKYAVFGKGVGGRECLATLWLDGIRVAGGAEAMVDRRGRVVVGRESAEIDPYVNPNELAGVEVYARGALAPTQFVPPGDLNAARCAIIAFWTKHGR